MNFECKEATIKDLDTITHLRIEFLRLANNFSLDKDMSDVEKVSESFICNLFQRITTSVILYLTTIISLHTEMWVFIVLCLLAIIRQEEKHIMNLYTDPKYRKQGIATKILDIIKEVNSRKIKIITLEATDMGKPLYEKYGFKHLKDEMVYEITF